ncbi:hypothetical protein N8T08_005641 [Aspergillus melleus]|uniref:Uncharacterized protein n=1 Tax=Aspergillus melleus TaxID=138277 RepID=A0ACC3B1S0_9EURO|nr:hypothetical protein N8T08_005641 [Aspergillus melleus]
MVAPVRIQERFGGYRPEAQWWVVEKLKSDHRLSQSTWTAEKWIKFGRVSAIDSTRCAGHESPVCDASPLAGDDRKLHQIRTRLIGSAAP